MEPRRSRTRGNHGLAGRAIGVTAAYTFSVVLLAIASAALADTSTDKTTPARSASDFKKSPYVFKDQTPIGTTDGSSSGTHDGPPVDTTDGASSGTRDGPSVDTTVPPRYDPPPTSDGTPPSDNPTPPSTDNQNDPDYVPPSESEPPYRHDGGGKNSDRPKKHKGDGGSDIGTVVAVGAAAVAIAAIAEQQKAKDECNQALQRVKGLRIDEARDALPSDRFVVELKANIPKPSDGEVVPGTVYKTRLQDVRDGRCEVRLVYLEDARQLPTLPPAETPSPLEPMPITPVPDVVPTPAPPVVAAQVPKPPATPKPAPKPVKPTPPKPPPSPCDAPIEVVAVKGMTERDARAALSAFTIEAVKVPSARPEDEVLEQLPAPPATLDCRDVVALNLSDGTLTVVPAVATLPIDGARARIEEADLVHEAADQDSDRALGEVLTQDPAAGTEVARRSAVRLTVSAGLVVPDVTRLPLLEAMRLLAPFRVSPARDESDAPKDQVTWQTPIGGTRAAAGSLVSLRISIGPPPLEPTKPKWPKWVAIVVAALLGAEVARRMLPKLFKASARIDTDLAKASGSDARAEGPSLEIDARLDAGDTQVQVPGGHA